ncbi:RINT-1 / TIP-1 family [Rhizoctonia solani]|uniref:RINT-1 / TIP-1 family n=1 Tax=Rhizoctonia solani TaxID=456999 RepID=A0A8H7IIB2_9AGAM|nr:RINT-1 / TIP-1 family [Rhizoctonia solani]
MDIWLKKYDFSQGSSQHVSNITTQVSIDREYDANKLKPRARTHIHCRRPTSNHRTPFTRFAILPKAALTAPRPYLLSMPSGTVRTNPSPNIEFIFHGTGTSSSVPNIACITADPITCETCGSTLTPEGQKNKRRNTGGILRVLDENQATSKVVVIDVGKTFLSAAYDLFPRYGLRRIDAVILTHPHADGWTLKKSIQAYIDIYVSAFTFKEVQKSFPYLVAKEFATGGGDIPEFRWHIIKENESFHVDGVDFDITPIAVHHGRLFTSETEENGNMSTPNDTPIPSGTTTPARAPDNSTTLNSSRPSSERSSAEITEQRGPADALNGNGPKLSPKLKPTTIARLAPSNHASADKPKPYWCFGFIFGDFMVYMSDVSYIPEDAWKTIYSKSPKSANSNDLIPGCGRTTQARYKVLVVDCLKLEPHTSHFGLEGALDAAKQVNAQRTYMVGFSHRITHNDWDTIGEYIEGIKLDESRLKRPNVAEALRILPPPERRAFGLGPLLMACAFLEIKRRCGMTLCEFKESWTFAYVVEPGIGVARRELHANKANRSQGTEANYAKRERETEKNRKEDTGKRGSKHGMAVEASHVHPHLLPGDLHIKTLLSPPDASLSETRALEYLDSNFSTWESIEKLSSLDAEVQRTFVEARDLEKRLEDSQKSTDSFIYATVQRTGSLLDSAQELSLKRHLIADDILALRDELSPVDPKGKQTLLSELEELHKRIAELEGAKNYLQILERGLQLSGSGHSAVSYDRIYYGYSGPIQGLSNFVSKADSLLANEDSESETPTIAKFLRDLRSSTWKEIKGVFSNRLVEASEKLSWPLPINLTGSSRSHVEAFQQAFIDLLSLQAEGEAIQTRNGAIDNRNERDGLYSLEALILPIALRFKFHFDGTRPTNRLDKGFMEHFIQPLIDKSPFHDINAQNEFTRLLFPILARKIRKSVPQLLAQPSLLAHTIYQALLFDAAVRESGFTLANTWEHREAKQHKVKEWPGVADVILSHKSWFDEWMDAERHFTEHQYNEIITSPDAFGFSNDGNEEFQADIRPTNSARRIKALLEQVTERYQPLPHYNQRARFLITVQVPILEAYYARISSSLDAFETLSSSFVRAVPGHWPGKLEQGAFAIKGAMEEWGDSIFFLELWTEINERSALRAKVDAHPSLPQTAPTSTVEEIHGTLFDELISQYNSLVARAEDMIIRHICSEVEGELKGYFAKQWESSKDNDEGSIAVPATLVSPLTILTTHLSLLVKTLPSPTSASLYRRIASSIASHILYRSVLHFGRGHIVPSRGAVFAREVHLWIEASQMAMPNRRVEAAWQRLIDSAKLVSIPEGPEFEAAKNAVWRASDEQCVEFAELIGVKSLSRKDMQDALRARSDC